MQSDVVRGLHPHPQVGDPGDLEEALDWRKELCGGAPAALRGGLWQLHLSDILSALCILHS